MRESRASVSRRCLMVMVVSVALAAVSPSALAKTAIPPVLTGPQGVAFLNQQREANGIPGGLVEEPHLSEGCRDHVTYYHDAPGQYPHEEKPGQPGYTPAGAEAASQSDLAPLAKRPAWTRDTNPWWELEHPAPLHVSQLFNPAATTTWYGESINGACMGTTGTRAFTSPSFYIFPSEAGLVFPPYTRAAEAPYTPQVTIGIPGEQKTGPNFVLWSEDTDATISSATLSDSKGQSFPVSIVPPSSPSPPPLPGWPAVGTIGEYSEGASFLVPPKPLYPNEAYALTVNWTSPTTGATYTKTVSFKTTGQLIPGPYIRMTLAVVGHALRVRVSPYGIGHPLTVTVKPCRNIPKELACYGTHTIYYRRTIRIRRAVTTISIPHLAQDGEVNIEASLPTFIVGDEQSGAGNDICSPSRRCGG